MTLKVYYFDASPAVRAVLMVIRALHLGVEFSEVKLSSKEQFDQIFLELNPAHTAPVIDDNGLMLWDSHAIVQYLVDQHGKNDDYYPKLLDRRTKINEMLFFNASNLFPVLAEAVIPVYKANAVLQSSAIAQDSMARIETCFQHMEHFLSKSQFLSSTYPTIADICAVSTISSIATFKEIDDAKYPNLNKWFNTMKSHDMYNANLPGVRLFTEMFHTS